MIFMANARKSGRKFTEKRKNFRDGSAWVAERPAIVE
jgi:hypothetical protein